MKNAILTLLICGIFLVASCTKKKEVSENFKLLTAHAWQSDSLLVNGVDASGPAGLLADFRGDAKFNADGSGTFGSYPGSWVFTSNETQLIITSDSLLIPITARIVELTTTSLKITTGFPNQLNPMVPLAIRMTFKPR
jgi:energy-coupling factor transporter transmembrane protein EcfT